MIYNKIRSTSNKYIINSKVSHENSRYQNMKKEENHLNLDEIDSNEDNNNGNNEDIDNIKKEDDDVILTTTITEVFKDGELINKETREKMDGVMKSLYVYSPDKEEYEKFLRNTKLGQKQMIKRYNDGLPVGDNYIESNVGENCFNIDNVINNERNPFKVDVRDEEDENIEQ